MTSVSAEEVNIGNFKPSNFPSSLSKYRSLGVWYIFGVKGLVFEESRLWSIFYSESKFHSVTHYSLFRVMLRYL